MHGIISLGRSYGEGTLDRSTTTAQDRRIVQEILRDLAEKVPGVDAEQLVRTFTRGLAELGFMEADMKNLIEWFDGVRAEPVVPAVPRAFAAGDRVRSVAGKAKGVAHSSIVGVGLVQSIDDEGDIRVVWPEGNDYWFHDARDLLLESAAPAPVVFAIGDKVRCPSGLAQNGRYGDVSGVGTVELVRSDRSIRVQWPTTRSISNDWWHFASELVKVPTINLTPAQLTEVRSLGKIQAIKLIRELTPGLGLLEAKQFFEGLPQTTIPAAAAAPSLADVLTPSIINTLKRRISRSGQVSTSIEEDIALVAALLDNAQVRAAITGTDERYSDERGFVGEVLKRDFLDSDEAGKLVKLYDLITNPEAAARAEKTAKIAALRAEAEALERTLF